MDGSENIHFQFSTDVCMFRAYHAESQRFVNTEAKVSSGRATYRFAFKEDWIVTQGVSVSGVVDFDGYKLPVKTTLLPFNEGITPDEITLIRVHKPLESGLKSCIFDREFSSNQTVRLFDTQTIHCANAEGFQS